MTVESPSPIAPEAVREELARILDDEAFVRSSRMRRFLSFVVEEALAGRTDQLAEYSIGLEVFDRGPDFEPGLDPIVRNDARRLRQKLMEYYRRKEQGRGTGVLIEIPKGGYAPSFAPIPPRGHADHPSESAWRLAVLPFEDLSPASEAALLCRALARSLAAGLTNLHGLEMISHAFLPSGPLRARSEPPRLDYVVEGGVQPCGARLQAVVALVRVGDGAQQWARCYELDTAAISAVPRDPASIMARDIAGFLGLSGSRRALSPLAA